MTQDQEREAFEAWADSCDADLSQYLMPGDAVYAENETEAAWAAWKARAALAQPASVPAEPAVSHSALAGMILTHMGYSTSPSLEPGADERRDRLAEKLAGWLSAAPAAPQPAQADDKWRKLALQFDGQRMAAMAHLRTLLAFPDTHAEVVRKFLAASPSEQAAPQPEAQPVPDVSDLLVMAVECGLVRMPKIFDADLQDALVAFAKRLTAPSAQASQPEAQPHNNEAGQLLRQVFALCEDTEDAPEREPRNEHQRGFEAGRRFEAKQIRRAIGAWFQDEFCGRSLMGEPISAAPSAQAEQAAPQPPVQGGGS